MIVTTSKYFTPAQVEDIMTYTESCRIMWSGREGVRKSNRGG
jgi:hypothetical protein